MRTHKTNGGVIPGSGITMAALEAPANPGYAFLGGTGWIGAQCACGYVASARTLAGVQTSLTEHQVPQTCEAFAQYAQAEDEDTITE